jgi:hypothetical protein
MSLTTAQMADVRRYMGYSLVGTTMQIGPNHDVVYGRFGMTLMSLYTRLTTLTADEEAVLVNTYLANLGPLETAIFGAGANLDTDQAAIWTHNKREVADRTSLFNQVRRALCEFIGFPPGGTLGTGGNSIKLVRA